MNQDMSHLFIIDECMNEQTYVNDQLTMHE